MKQLLYIPEGRYINGQVLLVFFSEAVPENIEILLNQIVCGDFSAGFYIRNKLPSRNLTREIKP